MIKIIDNSKFEESKKYVFKKYAELFKNISER